LEKVKLGFVPLHRDFFDEDWAVEIRNRVVTALSRLEEVELVVPGENLTKRGLVRNDLDAAKTVALFKQEGVKGVLIGTMTFGDELAGVEVAAGLRGIPVMVFGTKEPPFTSDGNRRSDSFCGTLSLASGLYRRKIPFSFAGVVFPEEPAFIEAVKRFARTCAIVGGFKGAKIGLIGPRPERFETCSFNEVAMIERFDQRLVTESLARVFHEAETLSEEDPEVHRVLREMEGQADVSEISRGDLVKLAKLEVVLRRIAREKGLAAMGVRCWTEMQEIYGVTPCFVMGRLTDSGIMAACEVDIYGALTMLIQYLATLKTTPPHFIDWTIRHHERENVFLAWHCGNAPPSLACPGCPVRLRYHSIIARSRGAGGCWGTGEFRLKPGPVTICRLAEYDGMFKMLVTKGRILESGGELRGSWSWVEVVDLDRLYKVLVEEGFVHHASIVHGDYVDAIKEACKFLGIKVVEV